MTKYEKYVEDVLNNKINAGNLIKQSCKRFKEFKDRPDIYFDYEQVEEAINFIAQIKHFLGKSAGKNFILEPWQEYILASILGFKYKETGYRVCKDVYIQVARKAGKDAFMAALSLYCMIAEGEASPQVACLANSRDQARILFEYIQKFGRGLDPKGRLIKFFRNYLELGLNGGSVKVYSADASTLDGLNISMGVIDEFHEAKDRKLYDVIKSSMGMRTQPLMIVITTAGFNLESPCHDMYKLSVEILGGVKSDDSFWPFIYNMDENDDIEDDSNWIKCQPNLGVTVSKDFMRQELTKMKNDSTAEVGVKTKTFNMWCTSSMVWIKPEAIVGVMKDVKLEDYHGCSGVIGVDLGSVNDLCAVSLMIPQSTGNVFFNWNFLPEETYKVHENKPLYDKFIKEGTLFITPGNVADYDYITNKIKEISETILIESVYYDRYNATQWAITMTECGFNLKPFGQNIGNYNTCTKEFQRMVANKEIVIQKSSNFVWQITCCSIKEDNNGNQKPIKTSWRTQKIDSVIAATTALGGWLNAGGTNGDFEIFTIGG